MRFGFFWQHNDQRRINKSRYFNAKKEVKILLRAYNAQAIITNRFGFSRTIN